MVTGGQTERSRNIYYLQRAGGKDTVTSILLAHPVTIRHRRKIHQQSLPKSPPACHDLVPLFHAAVTEGAASPKQRGHRTTVDLRLNGRVPHKKFPTKHDRKNYCSMNSSRGGDTVPSGRHRSALAIRLSTGSRCVQKEQLVGFSSSVSPLQTKLWCNSALPDLLGTAIVAKTELSACPSLSAR